MIVNRKLENGFTLVELLAVIVILAIILAIAIPSISNLVNSITKNAFESDAKMLIKATDYKMLENSSFDLATIDITTIKTVLGLQNNNYDTVMAKNIDGKTKIFIKGKNKWDGLYACGTYDDMSVVKDSTCTGFSSETSEACFIFDSGAKAIIGYSTAIECPRGVVIPSNIGGVDVVTIAGSAFEDSELTSVVIPSSVTSIGDWAFCSNNLTSITIPSSVTNIGWAAFEDNDLTSVTIPSSVTSIGNSAFNNNQLSDTQAFIYKRNSNGTEDKTTLISYGGAKRDNIIIPSSVTSIGSYVFSYNNLTSVTIPSTVTSIGNSAFEGNNLTSVTIPSSVTSIGTSAFNNNQLPDTQAFIYKRNSNGTEDKTTLISYGGVKKDNVIIPSSVTSIGNFAFSYNNLTSITIPSSVTSIGISAFEGNNLTSVTIPSSVTSIGESAFLRNQLTSVTIQGASPKRFNSTWISIGFPSNLMP